MLSVSACPKLKASSRGKSIPNRSKKALSRVFFRPTMASQMPISLIHGRMQEEKALTAGNSISPRRSTWEQKCLLNSRHAQVKRNKHATSFGCTLSFAPHQPHTSLRDIARTPPQPRHKCTQTLRYKRRTPSGGGHNPTVQHMPQTTGHAPTAVYPAATHWTSVAA